MNKRRMAISPKVFFTAASSICAVLLTAALILCAVHLIKADKAAEKSQLLDRAVIEASSIAETVKASDGQLDKAGQLMREHKLFDITESTLTLFYDDNMCPSAQTDSPYRAIVTKNVEGSCLSCSISIKSRDNRDEIYSLSFKTIISGGSK